MSTNQPASVLFQTFLSQLSQAHDKNEARAMLFLLFEAVAGVSKADILAGAPLDLNEFETPLKAGLYRLLNHEPVQHVTGSAWFMDDLLTVTADTLIPRQETEELVALIAKENTLTNPKILDIGTGSGAIALALKKKIPNAHVTAWDNDPATLAVAMENGQKLNRDVQFELKDLFNAECNTGFDLIVSNPPYIPVREKEEMSPTVWAFEPAGALFVPNENPLIFYKTIAEKASLWLNPGGKIYVEINERFGEETKQVFINARFTSVEVIKDLNDKDRFLRVFWASK